MGITIVHILEGCYEDEMSLLNNTFRTQIGIVSLIETTRIRLWELEVSR